MHVLAVSSFLFVMAFLIAVVEIEAEGKFGWAEKMPTWYRVTGIGRLYAKVLHKPLTGYHLALAPLTMAIFVWPLVATSTLAWASIFTAAAQWFIWVTVWDYLWFVLNPHYGWRKFRPDKVWWFAHERWFGPVPLGYLNNLAVSLLLAAFGGLFEDDWLEGLVGQTQQIGWYLSLVAVTMMGAPLFHKYHRLMRIRDDRSKSDIFHAP